MSEIKHAEHLSKGTFLMVCYGETYFTSIVKGPDIVRQMMVAMCGETEADWEPGEMEFWQEHISDPDNWCDDQDHGPTRFKLDVGETDHLELFLLTHCATRQPSPETELAQRALECKPRERRTIKPPRHPPSSQREGNEVRKVVCAAIRNPDGKIVAGARHWDEVMRVNVIVGGKRPAEWSIAEQGFIDQHCQFLTREEAWKVADAANQIIDKNVHSAGVLYSEDLY